ncbi:MAG: cytochrome c oxidase subunit II [Rhodothermales bacterium]
MNDTFWLPESASTMSPEIDSLFYFVTWASIILFVGVVAATIYLAVRYRRQDEVHVPQPVEPNTIVEISWIILPTILVLIIFNWGFKLFIDQSVSPPDAYEIQVRGSMWNWEFEYPNGTVTVGELHVPVDRPVRLNMSSVDVLHSFFVPEFRVKQDVLPDRYSSVWFEATRTDTFHVFCTEYCGQGHSEMLSSLVTHSQGDFEEWLASAGTDEDMPLPELGQQLYEQRGCAACHSIDGTAGIGPTLQGLYGETETLADGSTVEVDEDFLRESILEPGATIVEGYQNVMPAAYGNLSERELSGLIAYIEQLQ